jgi:predicted nucleotidyltransferase
MTAKETHENIAYQICTRVSGVVSIYLYGSQVHMLKNTHSDVDLQIVLTTSGPKQLHELRKIETEYRANGRELGLMVHTEEEIYDALGFPEDIFIHRNRCWFFVKEMKEHAVLLCGKDVFKQIQLPPQHTLFVEAVRVLRSLNYEARKKYINKPNEMDSYIDLVKYSLYASQYYCVVLGMSYSSMRISVNALVKKFPELNDLNLMLELKYNNYVSNGKRDEQAAEKAIRLLEYFAHEASVNYRKAMMKNEH